MYDPDKIFAELEKAGEERAKAEEDYHLLEKMGEILIGKLMWEANKKDKVPATICKEVARTMPEWETHIRGEAVALGRRSQARAHYENVRILAEARRSQEATARQLTR